MTDDDPPRNDLPYLDAAHAMQTGVAYALERDQSDGSPKHLRTGINSCMVTEAALARLLIRKGVITADEYAEEIRREMNREVDRYEDRLTNKYGTKVTLR